MKTKELIRQLQHLDPEGNCEVFGDGDIYYVDKLPWYYDGRPGILIRDESNKCTYNIEGMRQITEADGPSKIYLVCQGLDDLAREADVLEDYQIEGDERFKASYKKHFDDFKKLCADKKSERAKEKI